MIKYLGHKLELKYYPKIHLKNHYNCTKCLVTVYFSLNEWLLLDNEDYYLCKLDLSCEEMMIKKLLE